MAKINRHQLGKAEDMDSLEKLKRRAKKHEVKVSKATEGLLESMIEQNKRLSEEKLILSKLFRAAYRLLPEKARAEIDEMKRTIDSASFEDVHP